MSIRDVLVQKSAAAKPPECAARESNSPETRELMGGITIKLQAQRYDGRDGQSPQSSEVKADQNMLLRFGVGCRICLKSRWVGVRLSPSPISFGHGYFSNCALISSSSRAEDSIVGSASPRDPAAPRLQAVAHNTHSTQSSEPTYSVNRYQSLTATPLQPRRVFLRFCRTAHRNEAISYFSSTTSSTWLSSNQTPRPFPDLVLSFHSACRLLCEIYFSPGWDLPWNLSKEAI